MKTYIVDSFTHEYFKGNPAGVCFPETELTDDKMLLIAQELGLSETAFLINNRKKDSYSIRYFFTKNGNSSMWTCNTGISQSAF